MFALAAICALLAALLVQVSASPAHAESGTCPNYTDVQPPTVEAEKAIDLACQGISHNIRYSFGGGHGTHPGASYGFSDGTKYAVNDGSVKGYDCSGFMHWLWYAVTGQENYLSGGTADGQYRSRNHVAQTISASAGVGALRPGDVVFFGSSSHVHHVAMYIGHGKIVQESQSGTPANVANLSTSGYVGAHRMAGLTSNASVVDQHVADAQASHGTDGCGSGGCTTGCSYLWYNDHPGDPLCDGTAEGTGSGGDGGGSTKPSGSYWVTTFSDATGRDNGGTLHAGTNYVFCKVWGSKVGSGSSYNHWWLYTDMDTGGQDYVSAYYLSNWGNDEAKSNSGTTIPTCSWDGGSGSGSSGNKHWVTTFSSASGRDHGGTLNAGTNYVFCKEWGDKVGTDSAYNHWWLYTDMDTGGQDYVSAYYLSGQGNDEAKDNSGTTIPTCSWDGGSGSGGDTTTKYWVDTYASAPARDGTGSLNAGTNYVFCKEWGSKVGSGSSYNHWWLYTDLDSGGQGWVSAYYLSKWGNDEAKDNSGNTIRNCGADGKYWVTTFAATSGRDHGGTLNAGTNYVFCKEWGSKVGTDSAYNHWWLYTDMDTGGQDYVSAYYLSGQGNDEANDMYGGAIPVC